MQSSLIIDEILVLEINVHVDLKAITLLLLQFTIHVLTDVVVLDERAVTNFNGSSAGRGFKFKYVVS